MGWCFEEAGHCSNDEKVKSVVYHKSLNILLALTERNRIYVLDGLGAHLLHSVGLISHPSLGDPANTDCPSVSIFSLPGGSSGLFATSGQKVGFRHDLGGILLLETILQSPAEGKDEEVWVELPYSEAMQLLGWLNQLDLTQRPKANEWKKKLVDSLSQHISNDASQVKPNFKAASWSVITFQVPAQTAGIITTLREAFETRQPQAVAHLAALWSRLVSLTSAPPVANGDWSESSIEEGDTVKGLGPMALEANRLDSFFRWPHMKYRYALPEQMAQAGFFHQPNQPESDRALCFVCNVCLVCWEPNDEPWSEHERHAASCPYVNGSATPNVPLSVTMATSPAMLHGDRGETISCVSATSKEGLIATGTESGSVIVWNVDKHLKREISFQIGSSDGVNGYSNASVDLDHTLTSLCIVGPYATDKARSSQIHPSLIAGVSVRSINFTNPSRIDYSVIMSFEPMDVTDRENGDVRIAPVLLVYDVSRQLKSPSFVDATKNPKKKFSMTNVYHPASSGTQKEKKEVDVWYDGLSDPLVDSIFISDSMSGLGSKYGWPPPTKGKIQKVDHADFGSGSCDKYDDKYDPPVLQRIELTPLIEPGNIEWEVNSITPTQTGRNLLVVLRNRDRQTDGQTDDGVLILFSVSKVENKMKVFERPVAVQRVSNYPDRICMLPSDTMSYDEDDFSDETHAGYAVCIGSDGELKLLDLQALEYIANVEAGHGKFTSVTFCSSSDRIGVTAEDGSIYFYRATAIDLEPRSSQEAQLPTLADLLDLPVTQTKRGKTQKSAPPQNLLANEDLTPGCIENLVQLMQVSSATPYFSASAPTTWTELMSMPKSRRKLPAGLGYADEQYGKSWRLETEVSPWGEQIIELTLASSANLSHVDLRFNLLPNLGEVPHLEVSLLEHSSVLDFGIGTKIKDFDSKIDFPVLGGGGDIQDVNPVLSSEYLEAKEAVLLAGPVVMTHHLDLTGRGGLVTLTSPELLNSRGRTFLVHIIALSPKEDKACDLLGSESSLGLATPPQPVKGKEVRSDLRGCQLLQEISVTVRKLENCRGIQYERYQRAEMLQSKKLIPSLLEILAGESPHSANNTYFQEALDLLVWISSAILPAKNEGSSDKKLFLLQEFMNRCEKIARNCCIRTSRSTAKKFAQLCIVLAQSARTVEVPGTQEIFCRNLLQSILCLLPDLPSSSSCGGWRWLFMLIQRLQSLDPHGVMASCSSVLDLCFTHMEKRIHPLHTLLQTRYGFYGLAFEPELYAIPLSRPTYTQQNPTSSENPPYGTSPGIANQPSPKATSTQTPAHQAQSVKKILAGVETDKEARFLVQSESQLYGLLEVEPLGFSFFSASEGTTLENCRTAGLKPQRTHGAANEWESGLSKWSHLVSSPDLQQCILSIERMHSGARRYVVIDFGKLVLLTDIYTPACPNLMSITVETWYKRDESDLVRVALSSDIGTKPLLVTDMQPPVLCRFLKMTVIGKYGLNVNSIKIAIGSFYGHTVVLPSNHLARLNRDDPQLKLPILTKVDIEQELNRLTSLHEQTRCCYQIQSSYLKNFLSSLNSRPFTTFDHVTAFLRSVGEEKKKTALDEKILKFYQECLKLRVHLSTMTGVMKRLRRELDELSAVEKCDNGEVRSVDVWKSTPFPKLTLVAECVISTMIGLVAPSARKDPSQVPAPLPEHLLQRLMDTVVTNSPPYLQLYCATLMVHSSGREAWFGSFVTKCVKRYFAGNLEIQHVPQERIFMTLNFMAQKCISAGIGSSIIDALLLELEEQLNPLASDPVANIDESLVDWLLLLIVQCLDKMELRKNNGTKNNRWSFFGTDPFAKVNNNSSKKLKRNRGYSKLKSIIGKLPSVMPSSVYAVKVHVPVGEPMELGFDSGSKKITKMWKSCPTHSKSKMKSKSKSKSPKDPSNAKSSEQKPDRPLNKDIARGGSRALIKYLLCDPLRYDVASYMLALKVLSQILKMAGLVFSLDHVMSEDDVFGLVNRVVENKRFPPVVNGAEGATGFGEANSDEWYRHVISCFLEELLSVDKASTPTTDQSGAPFPGSPGASSSSATTGQDASASPPPTSEQLTNVDSDSEGKLVPGKDFFEIMSLDPNADDYESDDALLSYFKAKEPSSLMTHISVPTGSSGSGMPLFKKSWPSISKYFKKIESSIEKGGSLKVSLAAGDPGAAGESFANQNGPSSPYMDTASPNLGIQHRLDVSSHIRMDIIHALRENQLVNALASTFEVTDEFAPPESGDAPSGKPQVALFQAAFNRIFVTEIRKGAVDLERALSLWITLNNCGQEASKGAGETGSIPSIVFTQDSINSLLEALSSSKTISLKGWCLVFHALEIICKQRTTQPTSPRYVLGIFDPSMGTLMASLLLKKGVFSSLIYSFLSGGKIKSSELGLIGTTHLCGPSVVNSMTQFMSRLRIWCEILSLGGTLAFELKREMLDLLVKLCAEDGPILGHGGPVDAQTAFVNSLVELDFKSVDAQLLTQAVNAIIGVVTPRISQGEGVFVSNGSHAKPNGTTCFGSTSGSSQSSVLRSGDKPDSSNSYDGLLCSLLQFAVKTVAVKIVSEEVESSQMTDQSKIQRQADDAMQTDESKFQQARQAPSPSRVQSIADMLIREETRFVDLLLALNKCRASNLAIVLGPGTAATSRAKSSETSVGDQLYRLSSAIKEHGTLDITQPLVKFLAIVAGDEGRKPNSLTDPVMWLLEDMISSESHLVSFVQNGGLSVVCSAFLRGCQFRSPPRYSRVPNLLNYLNGGVPTEDSGQKVTCASSLGFLCSTPTIALQPSRRIFDDESGEVLFNFAPLCTISSSSETAQAPTVLLQTNPPHRRSRAPAWSHHFYPNESSVDLTITLPSSIMLYEVQLQPHLTSLSTCPGAVIVESAADLDQGLLPISGPLVTSGLAYISVKPSQPIISGKILLRLYKPKDSANVGLAQVKVLGTPALSVSSDRDFAKTSLTWLELLTECFSKAKCDRSLKLEMSQAIPDDVVLMCCRLLGKVPARQIDQNEVSTIVSDASLHLSILLGCISESLSSTSLVILKELLRGFENPQKESVEALVNLVYVICCHADDTTPAKLGYMLEWLENTTSTQTLAAEVLSCIAAALWHWKDDTRCNLKALLTEPLCLNVLRLWGSSEHGSDQRRAYEYLLCTMSALNFEFFRTFMNWLRVDLVSYPTTDDSKQGLEPELRLTPDTFKNGTLVSLATILQSKTVFEFITTNKFIQVICDQLKDAAFKLLANEVTDFQVVIETFKFFIVLCSEGGFTRELSKIISSLDIPLVSIYLNLLCAGEAKKKLPLLPWNEFEDLFLDFLKVYCWCHPGNQEILAKSLYAILSEYPERKPLIGFLPRVILQLLLAPEKTYVHLTAATPMQREVHMSTVKGPVHPRFGVGFQTRLTKATSETTVRDIIDVLIGMSNRPTSPAPESKPSTGSSLSSKRLSAVFNAVNEQLSQLNQCLNECTSQPSIVHEAFKDYALDPMMSMADCMSVLTEQGVDFDPSCLELKISYSVKAGGKTMRNTTSHHPTILTQFVSVGGLLVLARHLPTPASMRLLDMEAGHRPSFDQSDASASHWVKVGKLEDQLDDYDSWVSATRPDGDKKRRARGVNLPFHSLASLGLFLRIPYFGDALLKERKVAVSLLRLSLGVTDDGEGGDIFNSAHASTLGIVPFLLLRTILEDHPPNTDDGAMLRVQALEVGVLGLVLTCLEVFTSQVPRALIDIPGPPFKLTITPVTSEVAGSTPPTATPPSGDGYGEPMEIEDWKSEEPDAASTAAGPKAAQYWAKGTGYGTGSTAQNWDVEDALQKQKSQEEQATSMLLVVSAFIGGSQTSDDIGNNAGSTEKRDFFPGKVLESIQSSRLLKILSSYLRNDSIFDMARHVPLYKALLQLVRSLASSPQLVHLLVDKENVSENVSVFTLLSNMESYIQTYKSKLGHVGGTTGKDLETVDENDEGLQNLVSDIVDTYAHTKKFIALHIPSELAGDEASESNDTSGGRKYSSPDALYVDVMKDIRFDTYEMIEEDESGNTRYVVPYHYETAAKTAGERASVGRMRRLAQEAATLVNSLPLSPSSSVFVRCDTSRLDVMKVLITGPSDTPYMNGCFEFDILFPADYPQSPMQVHLETTGRQTVRFNPNLYNDGKVCLSVLNTWHGRPEEKWNPSTSSFLQVLVSVQSLILVPDPYFNEPGYERSRGTPAGMQNSRDYDANIRQATVRWAILEQIRNPSACFKDVIHTHYYIKKNEVLNQCQSWIAEMEAFSNSSKAVATGLSALKRHFSMLKEELDKLPCPPKLQQIVMPEMPLPSQPEPVAGPSGSASKPVSTNHHEAGDPPSLAKKKSKVTKLIDLEEASELDLSELLEVDTFEESEGDDDECDTDQEEFQSFMSQFNV